MNDSEGDLEIIRSGSSVSDGGTAALLSPGQIVTSQSYGGRTTQSYKSAQTKENYSQFIKSNVDWPVRFWIAWDLSCTPSFFAISPFWNRNVYYAYPIILFWKHDWYCWGLWTKQSKRKRNISKKIEVCFCFIVSCLQTASFNWWWKIPNFQNFNQEKQIFDMSSKVCSHLASLYRHMSCLFRVKI